MNNTYFSSTIYAIRCKESFSLSFNGYSNSWYERFDRTSSHCSSRCGCCDCCALSTYRVPIKLSLLNGLRQSTLLQMSASRRLILGVGEQYFSRLPAYGLHRGCYNLDCSVKERNVCNSSRRRIKERCFSAGLQKERERYHSFGSDDAEAVLSLLSEEADEDFIGIQWKNASSYKGREAEKKGKNISGDENLSLCKKVEIEKKGNLKHHETFTIEMKREDENSNKEKEAFKKCENGNFEHHETFTIDLKRENEKSKKEREAFTKSENHKKRRDVSSCSSYYSFSSSGDFGSGLEAQGKHGGEELSVGYEKDEANHLEGQPKEEFNRQIDDSEKLQDVSNRERTAFGADTDWNLRKKSEKKLSELTIEETESTKEVQDMHPRAFRTHESSYEKASISHKQLNSEEDNSSLAKDLGKEAKKAYFQTVNRSRHQSTDIQEYGGDEIKTALTSRKTFSSREGNLEMSKKMLKETSNEHKKIVGSSSTKGKDVANRNSQKYIGYPKIQDTERYSNTTMRNLGPSKVSVFSTVRGLEEQQHQKDEKIIIQTEERRKSRQFSEVSQVRESNVVDTSSVKSTTRIKSWEENLDISSDKRITQSIQPRKGSELVSTLSEGHASDQKQVSSSQRTSDKGRFIQRGKLTSIVKSRESSCQTDERITQFLLASEAQRPQNLSVSGETNSREESSFQGSLSLVSEARKHVLLAEGNERSSAIISIPSLSQLIGGGSAHVELTAGIASPEIFPGTSERSSSLYENPGRSPALLSESYSTVGSDQAYSEPSDIMVPEDALGSADRLEKASKQFVDEFVEKIRHEVTNLETQEIEATGTKLASEDAGNQICSSMQHGTQNRSQLKDRDSSRSSGFPGTKGPSDEMWDVTEPSVKQSSMAEEPKISKVAGKPIVNRTGRSLWSMIADVVRLRWGSRAGSSTSAGRSGERNSSNKSDSETWFSGPEHEETSRSNVINERTSVQLQAMTSDKLKPEKHDTRSEGDVSDIKILKDKGTQLEVGSSSPNTLESGSTSVGASYASGEENASWTEDGKDLKVSTSGIEKLELPVTLPARGPPIVEEIVNIGRSDMLSVTESVMPMEEPVAPMQTELSSSGRKDGELKQRKFQRNRQVLRDRFDEWEEAYKHELEQRRMDETFMMEAILEAKKAADTWEVPVGAVLVQHGKIIARGYNLVEELRDSTAHAEMICIREASNLLRTWRLSETTLYVTLEPCPMCAGAILQARIDTVVWGAPNKLLGADGSWIRLFPDGGENISEPNDKPPAPVHPFHPKMNIRRGVLATECADVMQQFFQLRRKKKKEPPRDPPGDPSCLPVVHNPSKFLSKMHNIFHFMFCW